MSVNRREFIILTVAAAAGCKSQGDGTGSTSPVFERSIDAGPVDNFAADGVYDSFREKGFFLIRHSGDFFAVSAVCTHRACKVNLTSEQSFYCKCHGSTFDANGKVTKGPAVRDLPRLPVEIDLNGRLLVKVTTGA